MKMMMIKVKAAKQKQYVVHEDIRAITKVTFAKLEEVGSLGNVSIIMLCKLACYWPLRLENNDQATVVYTSELNEYI